MTSNMIADLGTRRGAKLEDIANSSPWINGLPLMGEEKIDIQMKSVEQLSMTSEELFQIKKELSSNKDFDNVNNNHVHINSINVSNVPEEVISTIEKSKKYYDKLYASRIRPKNVATA